MRYFIFPVSLIFIFFSFRINGQDINIFIPKFSCPSKSIVNDEVLSDLSRGLSNKLGELSNEDDRFLVFDIQSINTAEFHVLNLDKEFKNRYGIFGDFKAPKKANIIIIGLISQPQDGLAAIDIHAYYTNGLERIYSGYYSHWDVRLHVDDLIHYPTRAKIIDKLCEQIFGEGKINNLLERAKNKIDGDKKKIEEQNIDIDEKCEEKYILERGFFELSVDGVMNLYKKNEDSKILYINDMLALAMNPNFIERVSTCFFTQKCWEEKGYNLKGDDFFKDSIIYTINMFGEYITVPEIDYNPDYVFPTNDSGMESEKIWQKYNSMMQSCRKNLVDEILSIIYNVLAVKPPSSIERVDDKIKWINRNVASKFPKMSDYIQFEFDIKTVD